MGRFLSSMLTVATVWCAIATVGEIVMVVRRKWQVKAACDAAAASQAAPTQTAVAVMADRYVDVEKRLITLTRQVARQAHDIEELQTRTV